MRKKGQSSYSLVDGEEVDFYHAAGHLDTALAAAYGDTHPKSSRNSDTCFLKGYKGVEKVIRSLVHLRDTYPRRKKIARELKYFRRNRHRMRYTALKEQGLPIGSGVTEAACKTLATQRMKRSGMRWGEQGGQAILSFRALVQSNRFERAWTLLAHTYKAEVTTLDNVVPIRNRKSKSLYVTETCERSVHHEEGFLLDRRFRNTVLVVSRPFPKESSRSARRGS